VCAVCCRLSADRMSCAEEQKGEIEALESIYTGDIEILETKPFYKFTIPIQTESKNHDSLEGMKCQLQFAYTANYPSEPPEIEIIDDEGMEEEHIKKLFEHLNTEAENNLGMVMIFTLVSAAQEYLNVLHDNLLEEKEKERVRLLEEEEEAEKKRFEGTRVTVETFLAWKASFDAEISALHKSKKETEKKLTGKELFLRDSKLNESDLQFLQDGDVAVQIDESLFQDLDDLELDDDDDS